MRRLPWHRHHRAAPPAERGFSLIELVVAMAIFAVLAVMTQQAVLAALSTETRLSGRRDELADLQRAVTSLVSDLENAAPRPVRNADGGADPVMELRDAGGAIVFTRGGLPNPAVLARSGFQRVVYALGQAGGKAEETRLDRRVWRRLDPLPGAAPAVQTMLAGVTGLSFRVYEPGAGWTGTWPDPDAPATARVLPRAVEIVLQTERWGRVRRVVGLR